ncbi:MAG: hypothetical protein LCH82_12180 [Actinobacteria bacterium]|nr:hypothetical protein [Actinomycetota bacterium]
MNVADMPEQPHDRDTSDPLIATHEDSGQRVDDGQVGSPLQPAPVESEGSDPAAEDPRAELEADNLNSMVHSPIPQADPPPTDR